MNNAVIVCPIRRGAFEYTHTHHQVNSGSTGDMKMKIIRMIGYFGKIQRISLINASVWLIIQKFIYLFSKLKVLRYNFSSAT